MELSTSSTILSHSGPELEHLPIHLPVGVDHHHREAQESQLRGVSPAQDSNEAGDEHTGPNN